MDIYHDKKFSTEKKKKMQNSKYSIFGGNDIIIKIRFFVIMPIFISKLYTSTKKELWCKK